jgi:hydroxyacylglutathione hydrolase
MPHSPSIPNWPAELDCEVVVSVPFEENTYLIRAKGDKTVIVVDPGLQPNLILAAMVNWQVTPAAILLTHGHADHIGGNRSLKQQFPDCPILISKLDEPKLSDPWQNLSGQFGLELTSPPADRIIAAGETLELAGTTWRIAAIPGHSLGHLVFINESVSPPVVIGGDVLFAGGIGRTDFPDGDAETLLTGIREHLYSLPDETIVLPGHGPATTIGQEKRTNPFVRA